MCRRRILFFRAFGRDPSVLAVGQNLGAGRIHSARSIIKSGPPHSPGCAGRPTSPNPRHRQHRPAATWAWAACIDQNTVSSQKRMRLWRILFFRAFGRDPSVLAVGQNLGAGRIHSARSIIKSGPPHSPGCAGRPTSPNPRHRQHRPAATWAWAACIDQNTVSSQKRMRLWRILFFGPSAAPQAFCRRAKPQGGLAAGQEKAAWAVAPGGSIPPGAKSNRGGRQVRPGTGSTGRRRHEPGRPFAGNVKEL